MNLNIRNKAAFGFGAFGKDLVYMLVSNYILYYYNVVLGVSSVFIGAVLMGARVFDALNDPIMGIIVAKTHTKHGKFRPWILAGTVLNALTIYALFAAPKSAGDGTLRLWLAVIYIAWGVTYTMMDIPFWSMIPAITKPGSDREQLSSIARSCSGVGDAIPMVVTMSIVPILSGSTVLSDYTKGFKWWALIIAVIFVIAEVVFVLNVPEKTDAAAEKEERKASEQSEGIGHMFKALFTNDQAMTTVGTIILGYTALNIVGNLILYFFQFDVGNTDAYSVFVAGCFAAEVLVMMFIPMIRKKVEKLRLFDISLILQIAGFAILLLFSYTNLYRTSSWLILMIPGVIVYLGYGILTVMTTIFLSDAVDYGELKNGRREESVIFSMQTFTVKLASGIAVFIAGIVIDVIGLDTAAASQSAATLSGLRMYMTIPSAILLVLAYILFKKCYRLSDQKMAEITKQLEEKKKG